jgi:hypothetical protein
MKLAEAVMNFVCAPSIAKASPIIVAVDSLFNTPTSEQSGPGHEEKADDML